MNKIFKILLIGFLILTGCNKTNNDLVNLEDVNAEEKVIINENDIIVKFIGIELNNNSANIKFELTNNTNHDEVNFVMHDILVNNLQPVYGSNVINVDSKETIEASYDLYLDYFYFINHSRINDIQFDMEVSYNKHLTDIIVDPVILVDKTPVTIETNAEPSITEIKGPLIYEDKNIVIYGLGIETLDYIDDAIEIRFLVKNKTDKYLSFSFRDIYTNNERVNVDKTNEYFLIKDSMSIVEYFYSENDLKQKNINSIDEIDFYFRLTDANTYKTIIESIHCNYILDEK